jgi:hypothetical protein
VLPALIAAAVIAVVVAVIALGRGGGGSSGGGPAAATTRATATTGVPPLVRESGSIFTIAVPRSWAQRDNTSGQGLKRSTWTDPSDSRNLLLVDPIPSVASTPEGRARNVDATLARTKPGYRQISLGPATIAGRAGYALAYEVSGVRYLDQFVNLDCQDGYAVQGQAPSDRFTMLESTFRASADSLRSKPC